MILKRCYIPIVTLALFVGCLSARAWPYDLETHRAINHGAVDRSSLNDQLRVVLGLPAGISTIFSGRNVREWIREGGAFEDDPITRTANHFHYPLREWNRALLTDPPGNSLAIQSSVLWAQNPDQRPFLASAETWSWIRARLEFRDALTMPDISDRNTAFGNTFRALGQVLHLVVDGSVPAHTRNDSHVSGEPLEVWLEAQAQRRPAETPDEARARFLARFVPISEHFSPSILGMPPNPFAPIPIAKVFDADAYDGTVGTSALTGGLAVGITEFANANFFSGSTVFADRFGTTHHRYSPLPSSGPPWTGGLDPVVHDEYARHLIPRAVGYSASLLDYFFRGRLDLAIDAAQLELRVTNRSDEAIGPGTLSVYCDDPNGNRVKLDEMTVTQEVQTDAEFPRIPLSFPAGTLRCVMVFEGKLGEEADAVIGKVFQLGIRPVARTGDDIPGGGTFGTFFFGRPTVNEAGTIVFNGVFADNQTEGIFLESQEVLQPPLVRAGDAAPGGGTFGFFGSLGLDDQGTVAFWGALGTPSNFTSGVFLAPGGGQLQALALPGDPATRSCGTTFTDFGFDSVSINNQGEVAFIGDFLSNAIPSCFDGLFVAAGGSVRKVAQQSDLAPGGGRFGPFFSDRTTILNEAGEVAFVASVSGSMTPCGLFLADGQMVCLVRFGDLAPGGGSFTSVGDPSLNDIGTVAFRGTLDSTTQGIFLRSSTGQLTAVARTDDPAPQYRGSRFHGKDG
jgi:hypothetical protein